MNVLLLTQVLPYPPDSGPKVKTWNVLKYLSRNHEVTLASFVRGDQTADIDFLRKYCKAVYTVPMERSIVRDGVAMVRSLITGLPWMMVRDDRREMRQMIATLSSNMPYDIVHADQLNMAQYAERVPGARKVLDEHNALWLLYQRLANRMQRGPRRWLLERDWRLLKRYEGSVCRRFDAVTAVSEEDRAALEEAMGESREISVIPIAIDTDEVRPVVRKPDGDHILHIGTMYWPPNIDGILWFLHQVFPLIRARRPDTIMDVVGARPPDEIVRFSNPAEGINVTGYVEDVNPYLEQAAVMVIPLWAGGGMRVKILNAMAQGLPIVSTSLGCEGIAVEDRRHILIADTPEQFAQATLKLLDERSLADQIGENGRRLAETLYDYRVACRPLDLIYRSTSAEPVGKLNPHSDAAIQKRSFH